MWDGAVASLSMADGSVQAYTPMPAGIAAVRHVGDKKLVGAGCDDGALRLLSSEGLFVKQVVPAHADILSSISAVDAQLLLTASWDQDIKLWDLNDLSAAVLSLKSAHYGAVNGCAVSSHQPHIFASVGADGMLRLWDRRESNPSDCVMLHAHDMPAACVEWDRSDGHRLFTGTDGGDLYSFDIRSIHNCSKTTVHSSRIRAIKTHGSYAGVAATCSDDTTIALVSTSTQEIIHRYSPRYCRIYACTVTDACSLPVAG